jgi:hypothetical protein
MKDLRLVSGYDMLYGKVKAFVQEQLSAELCGPVLTENPVRSRMRLTI